MLERSLERADLTGLAVLPMDPAVWAPVTRIGRPGLAPEPLVALTDYLLTVD